MASAWPRVAATVVLLVTWYALSASIILVSKWVLSSGGNFPFPLTITMVSNAVTGGWSFLVTRHPRYRAAALTRQQLTSYVLPMGLCTAAEIGASNVALQLLSVSYGTILKGTAPVFVMLWGLALGVERFSVPLLGCLLAISGGIALASAGEMDFVLAGLVLQLSATALGGFRWALTQVALKGRAAAAAAAPSPAAATAAAAAPAATAMPPLTATLYTSPATAAAVAPFALLLEGRAVAAHLTANPLGAVAATAAVLGGIASAVFVLLLAEYTLVRDTSSLALAVAGVFKELLTIAGGVVLFGDHLSAAAAGGFCVAHVGIGAYLYLRAGGEWATALVGGGGRGDDDDATCITAGLLTSVDAAGGERWEGGGGGDPPSDGVPLLGGYTPLPAAAAATGAAAASAGVAAATAAQLPPFGVQVVGGGDGGGGGGGGSGAWGTLPASSGAVLHWPPPAAGAGEAPAVTVGSGVFGGGGAATAPSARSPSTDASASTASWPP